MEVDKLNLAERLEHLPHIISGQRECEIGDEKTVIRDSSVLVSVRVKAWGKSETGGERRIVLSERNRRTTTTTTMRSSMYEVSLFPLAEINRYLRVTGKSSSGDEFSAGMVSLCLGKHDINRNTHDDRPRKLNISDGYLIDQPLDLQREPCLRDQHYPIQRIRY